MSEPVAAPSRPGTRYAVVRGVAYALSLVGVLYLWVFRSPYQLSMVFGQPPYYNDQYYDDDRIFAGIMVSALLGGMHAVGALSKALLYRQKPSGRAWFFLTFYFAMACYWVYHLNSNGARHE